MARFVTIQEVRDRLRVDAIDGDADLSHKIDEAEDIVFNYLKRPVEEWDEEPLPFRIRAAILLVVRNLHDDIEGDPLSEGVRSLLHRDRDPAIA